MIHTARLKTERYYDSLDGMLGRFDSFAAADRYKGNDLDSLKQWQVRQREVLSDLMGLSRLMDADYRDSDMDEDWECTEEECKELKGGIRRLKLLLKLNRFDSLPMYVLEPAGESKGTFLALAGHQGAGKYSVAGVSEIPAVREKIEFFGYDYGLKLAELGYTAICPDPRGFGDRRDKAAQGDETKDILSCSCRNVANMAIPLGLSVAGLCVYDYINLIDYIESSGRWSMDNLGCIGFSGGGMQTLYLTAVEPRIKRAVISGYMYGVRDALLILNNNCSCNYIPGLWEHMDMGDVACLIAPRPLLIQSCRDDHLNGPRGLENVYEQMDIIRKAYELYGEADRLKHDIRPGEHHFHSEVLKPTLEEFDR